jgi:hypothetical protein
MESRLGTPSDRLLDGALGDFLLLGQEFEADGFLFRCHPDVWINLFDDLGDGHRLRLRPVLDTFLALGIEVGDERKRCRIDSVEPRLELSPKAPWELA